MRPETVPHLRTLRALVAALVFFGVDRFSKIAMLRWLDLPSHHDIPVWPPYLQFVMAWNYGVNFGWFSGVDLRWLLVGLSLAISVALLWWVRRARGWLLPMAAGMVAGGALGNAYDRVFFGAVVDYINMSCCGIMNPYSFNVADVWIFVGTMLLVYATDSTGVKQG